MQCGSPCITCCPFGPKPDRLNYWPGQTSRLDTSLNSSIVIWNLVVSTSLRSTLVCLLILSVYLFRLLSLSLSLSLSLPLFNSVLFLSLSFSLYSSISLALSLSPSLFPPLSLSILALFSSPSPSSQFLQLLSSCLSLSFPFL